MTKKQMVYELSNDSASEGFYTAQGTALSLKPGEIVYLQIQPTSLTANIKEEVYLQTISIATAKSSQTTKTDSDSKKTKE